MKRLEWLSDHTSDAERSRPAERGYRTDPQNQEFFVQAEFKWGQGTHVSRRLTLMPGYAGNTPPFVERSRCRRAGGSPFCVNTPEVSRDQADTLKELEAGVKKERGHSCPQS